jgi:hypothetical protein
MKGEYKRPTGLLGRAVFFTFALAFVFGLLLTTAATASWRYEVVEPAGRTSDDVSLALDTQGGPCIAYTDDSETGGTMNLRYVSGTYTGGSWDWRRETVDAHGLYDFFPSLAVDGDDNPHISGVASTATDSRSMQAGTVRPGLPTYSMALIRGFGQRLH